jgi:hypothetical protein
VTPQDHEAKGEGTEQDRYNNHCPICLAQAPDNKDCEAADKDTKKHGYERTNCVSVDITVSDSPVEEKSLIVALTSELQEKLGQ